MKIKLLLYILPMMLAFFFLLPSCGEKEESLYFLNFKPEAADVFSELAVDYKKETGNALRVVTAASGTYEQTLKSEIGKNDPPILFQINGPKGYASWKDYCLDLSGSELYSHLSDKSLAVTDGEGVFGLPSVVEGYGIIYNSAITNRYFALENRQTNVNSMSDVTSFDSLRTLTEDMTAHKAELNIEGVFAVTSLKSGEDWRFQTHLANIPIYYEWQNGGVDMSGSGTKTVTFAYSDEYKRIFDLYIDNSTTDKKLLGTKQVTDSMAEFALEKCAMVQNGTWAWEQIKNIGGNKVVEENIHFLPIYMGIDGEENSGLSVGTENYFAVNKQASEEKQKAALDFLTWLYTSETGKNYVVNKLDFIVPYDTFSETEKPSDPLAREMLSYLEKDNLTSVPWCFTAFPGQAFKTDFGAALLQYAQGTKTWESVVNTFVTRWEEENR